jgi:uncharacterized membrane protein YdjX (TVP38/TMEM64 family)
MSQLKQEESSGDNTVKWLQRGLLALLVLSLLWASRQQLLDLLHFFRDRGVATAYLEPLGSWGPLLYLAIVVFQVLTATIPGHALMIAAGYLYGFPLGLALNTLGGIGASQLAFVIARRAGLPWVSRVLPQLLWQRWHHIIRPQGFFFFLTCFWLPIVPHNATNYLAGLCSISFWRFWWANFLGRLPGMVIVTLIGAYGLEFSWQQWLVIGVAGLLFIAGGHYLAPKIQRRFL